MQFIAAGSKTLADIASVTEQLAAGNRVLVVDETQGDLLIAKVQFKATGEQKTRKSIMTHGIPARDLDTLISYISGDAHDRSKVEWFDGQKFNSWF